MVTVAQRADNPPLPGRLAIHADDEEDDLDLFQCIKDHDIESVQVRLLLCTWHRLGHSPRRLMRTAPVDPLPAKCSNKRFASHITLMDTTFILQVALDHGADIEQTSTGGVTPL